ncbi:asparagine synthase (glutamine-hydrolyzing) [Vulcanibacillus modesticaldus]|uniref:asparagine synthase (glutamine-hydrolyzing) n=1 Tax=Vulcanibacillus modesticaldus TaxID=337097 RepID=A0A1D2YW55_9BACI|nr:asparagine synthase (glutamine-hydrolyzing) [Vulcanibacillus modesticaldus]OEF99877.1 asparagine synthase (glutamine-hydrolyzing) [Vulcanibacillus modesticaldus]
MCGFCGFIDNMTLSDKDKYINAMMDKIIHRGPDGSGKYVDENISLGFRRLSIIDLAEGSQPLYNENNDLVLVFNGEIYNYQYIREDLIAKGHIFRTNADSEVILHAYEEYGTGIFDHLRGMFAFVIWDIKNRSLFGARDFFGIKPFYYAQLADTLVFGSEIKSILEHPAIEKELNMVALENYLSFQYSALSETFFKGIYKLPPAHYFIYKDGKMEIKKYWEVSFREPDSQYKSLEDFVDATEQVMQDSIKMHKVSDVEVGSFLSSGIDSSYVAASFQGDKTFTVGFGNEKYNEIDEAKKLSQEVGIQNYHKVISKEEYWNVIPKVQYFMDEPLADPAAVALYFVSQLASKHVKVVLSGEGADELFGGYNIYKEPLSLQPITRLPMSIRKMLGLLAEQIPFDIKGKNYFIRASKTVEERFIGNAFIFNEEERQRLLKDNNFQGISTTDITKPFYEKVEDQDDITKMQYLDIHMWLTGDILLKADKMSMAHSLELRVPFLDKEVAKIATQIPVRYRVNEENTKYTLRLAAKRKLKDIIANRKKLGFPVPIRVWLKEDKYYNLVKKTFTSEIAKKLFNHEELVKLLDDHYHGKKDNSRKIWTVYTFLIWYDQYFVKDTKNLNLNEYNEEKILMA